VMGGSHGRLGCSERKIRYTLVVFCLPLHTTPFCQA
jgi:hypothetical protein